MRERERVQYVALLLATKVTRPSSSYPSWLPSQSRTTRTPVGHLVLDLERDWQLPLSRHAPFQRKPDDGASHHRRPGPRSSDRCRLRPMRRRHLDRAKTRPTRAPTCVVSTSELTVA